LTGTAQQIGSKLVLTDTLTYKKDSVALYDSAFRIQKKDGKVIGKHQGAQYYTIGQSKGLGIGGHKESCFIISRDMFNNILFVGEGKNFPGLFGKVIKIKPEEVHWVRSDRKLLSGESLSVMARIRYRQALEKATLYQFEEALYIEFETPQSAIAEGQFAAWYEGDELLGSGVID
jgi:tRNA-specific 2-thiouridylase